MTHSNQTQSSHSVLEAKSLKKIYQINQLFEKPKQLAALRGVSFNLKQGETLAVVGESGCGKSTLAKLLMKIEPQTEGQFSLDNKDASQIGSKELSNFIQMIFQDPYSSLNPRKKIFQIIAEPLVIKGVPDDQITEAVNQVASDVGLRPEMLERYPHMLSGGQRQRVGIARALVTRPKVIICDEPVSALDVSVQAQVLNLLIDIQKKNNLSYLFISHDLGVVRFIADRVAVMYLGEFVEFAESHTLFKDPKHPYTQMLLSSTPSMKVEQGATDFIASELPSPLNPPSGCAFHTRCPYVTDICKSQKPQLKTLSQDRLVSCHNVDQVKSLNLKNEF